MNLLYYKLVVHLKDQKEVVLLQHRDDEIIDHARQTIEKWLNKIFGNYSSNAARIMAK